MDWDLKELKDSVLHAHGKSAYSNLSPCLNSLAERTQFTRYHYHEAKELLAAYMGDDYSEMELFRLVFAGDDACKEVLEGKTFQARAHIVGCVQSLHSVSDILSHVIYYALNMSQAKSERDISIHRVLKWVGAHRQLDKVKDGLATLIRHPDYAYLCALANFSKHRSIISINFNFNLRESGTKMKELVFPSFTYDEKCFRATDAYSFLESEFNRESKLVIEIGNELNRLLRRTS